MDRMGGGGSWAGSPCCQHPSESPGVTWEQGKTREIQGRMGGGEEGEGVGTGEAVPSTSSPGPQVHPASPPLFSLSICFGCRCVTLQLGHEVAGGPCGASIAGLSLFPFLLSTDHFYSQTGRGIGCSPGQ